MRKITKLAAQNFNADQNFKLSNTEVKVTENTTSLYLHGNEIARKNRKTGELQINNYGWLTPTTKDRINAVFPKWMGHIYQKRGRWYFSSTGHEMANNVWVTIK